MRRFALERERDNSERSCRRSCVAICVTEELLEKILRKNMNQTIPSPVKETVETSKKCPACRKDVDTKATKCPYCQSDTRSWVKKHQIGLIILAVIFVPIFMSALTASPTANVPVERTAEEIAFQKKNDFASLAKMNVEMMLKAPSTAKFNTSPTITEEDSIYSINSWVDSENSYGANVRSSWSAKAHYIGGDSLEETGTGANWIIDEFYFDGEKIK